MDAETWRWIWLGAVVVFALGELATAGSFFLLPFAVGALVSMILAFADIGLVWQWIAFVGVSGASFAALFPLRHRLDRDAPAVGVGAKRLIGEPAKVLEPIPGGQAETGLVRVGREEWRAESVDGRPVPVGQAVKVVEVRGTRVVVWPLDQRDLTA